MDADILRIVLGRPVSRHDVRSAVLEGYRRVCVAEETYPAAYPDPEARIEGLVVDGITEHERDRVQFFEGLEFALEDHPVRLLDGDGIEVVSALVCMATDRLVHTPEAWHFEHWIANHKPGYLEATATYMEMFEALGIEEAHAVWIAELSRAR